MASSIHIEEVKTGSFLHNDRTMKVSYLITNSENNYCSDSSDDVFKKFNNLKKTVAENYKNRTGQKLQKSVKFLKEAIINLEEHHTEKDLEPIIEKLKSYGFTILQTSIHRDEGFKDDDDKNNFNYHAHITMFNLKEDGTTVKFGKNYRTELSKLQTFTADALGMERGTCSVKEEAINLKVKTSKAKRRLGTHEFKQAKKVEEKLTKLLKKEIKELREELKKRGAVRADYANLEKLNRDFKEQIRTQNVTIEQLKDLLEHQREQMDLQNSELSKERSKSDDMQNKLINSLKTQNNRKDEQILVLKEKINSTQDMNLKMAKENEELRAENKDLKIVVSEYKRFFSDLAEELGCQKTFLNIASALDTVIEQSKKYVQDLLKEQNENYSPDMSERKKPRRNR